MLDLQAGEIFAHFLRAGHRERTTSLCPRRVSLPSATARPTAVEVKLLLIEIHRVRQLRRIRRPPALGDDAPVPGDDEAVQLVFACAMASRNAWMAGEATPSASGVLRGRTLEAAAKARRIERGAQDEGAGAEAELLEESSAGGKHAASLPLCTGRWQALGRVTVHGKMRDLVRGE